MYANWFTRDSDVKLYYDCFYKIYISNTHTQSTIMYFNNNFFNIDDTFFVMLSVYIEFSFN